MTKMENILSMVAEFRLNSYSDPTGNPFLKELYLRLNNKEKF